MPLSEPLVSVVIPAYNCASHIEETLQSVLTQTRAELEVIVVDDASDDDTLKILRRLAGKDVRIRVLESPHNMGQGACRNRGVREAGGRFVAYLDADDIWLPQKLERQLEYLEQRQQAFCFCGYGTIDEAGNVVIPDLKIPAQTDYRSLLKSNTICPSSVLYDRQRMDDIVMPERPVRREDLISWLHVSKRFGGALSGIPEPLCMVRRLRGSSSSNKLKTLRWQWRVYREAAGLGVLSAAYYLINFAFTSLAKRSPVSVALKRHKK